MPRTGQKKVAPVNMKKEEHQFVIDGYLIDEVLHQIPPKIKIIQAQVVLMKRGLEQRIAVPNNLRKLGVMRINDIGACKRAFMQFDATSHTHLRDSVKQTCEALQMPYPKSYFKYIVLAIEGAACKFLHCTKEIKPDELDQRKKLRVLGATEGQGRVQSLLAELGAKKFKCTIKEEPVKLIMCSRE